MTKNAASHLLSNYRMKTPLTIIIIVIFHVSDSAINPHCDYHQDVVLGQEYFIYNREYPNLYPPSTSCRWSAASPYGTVILLSCNDVNISVSNSCHGDRLSVSSTADFQTSQNYCGQVAFATSSERNFLSIGLFSGDTSSGGTFVCSLAAMRVAPSWCSCSPNKQEEVKIVGGQETKINEFVSMAALIDATTEEAYCGAIIISDRYALTAAHCLLHKTSKMLGLLVGDHDLNSGNDTASAALYTIDGFLQHPMFDSRDESNDIAVLKTSKKIQFNVNVGAACLPFRFGRKNFENEIVTVLGWGFTDISGYKATKLQKVNLTVISNSFCAQALHQHISSTQLCTYTRGKDSCVSDSGGPLLFQESKGRRFYLVGLVSFGISCATKNPAVNTRITSFLSWVASVTSDAAYCIR